MSLNQTPTAPSNGPSNTENPRRCPLLCTQEPTEDEYPASPICGISDGDSDSDSDSDSDISASRPASPTCGISDISASRPASPSPGSPITSSFALCAKRQYKLRLAGAETAAERAAARGALHAVCRALAAAVEAGVRSMDCSYEELRLLGGVDDGDDEVVDEVGWRKVAAEVSDKADEIQEMCRVLQEIKKMLLS